MTPALGVYLHVPYCAVRCSYCDFVTYTSGDRSTWADTAIAEVRLAAELALGDGRRRPVSTVFFGGGTPTLLPPGDLGRVLDAVREELGLVSGAEVTVEANPDSVDPRSMAALLELGATRLSLGMQSAAPHVLALMGRTHEAMRPVEAAREAYAAGFEHVSLDLIFGTPGETQDDWGHSVETALSAAPDHVSAYGLEVVPGTRMFAQVRRGELAAPDQDELANRYLLAEELLGAAGLRWYEVSNFATGDAARCHHNLGYWHGGEWLGIGPGAHSGVGGRRWFNVKHPGTWAAAVARGELPIGTSESLDAEQLELERLMLAVRTRGGVPVGAEAAPLARDGLLDVADGRGVLTLRGRLLADHVTRRLAHA